MWIFGELLRECNIPLNPLSAYNYNPSSIGLAEHYVSITKVLLKKCLDSKEDYQVVLATLNSTARPLGFLPAEKFMRQRLRTSLPDICEEQDLEEAAMICDENHTKMRENSRGNKHRSVLEIGDIVIMYEETGAKKGSFRKECEVISARPGNRSYFIREIVTGALYLRNWNKMRPLKEAEPDSMAVSRLDSCTFVMEPLVLASILKKEGGSSRMKKNYSILFNGTFYVARARLLVDIARV